MALPSSVLDAMLAAGCTPEQIVAAVKAANDDEAKRVAERRQKETERKRRQRAPVSHDVPGTTRDSAGHDGTAGDVAGPLSPLEVSPQTPFPKTPNPIPPSPPKGGSSPTDFDAFWEIYPNKVGKADARKKFAKAVQVASLETIMFGLERYAAKTDDRPWCNPATWLHQERWGDQPADNQPRGSPPNQAQRRGNLADYIGAIADHKEAHHEHENRETPSGSVLYLPAHGGR
ncbi:hypothetical protein SAMN04487974_102152 [Pelagibacterium luteolum]|uniref:Uncharacterized protein n=1 Tax=Pelagibacterium luteolum TaxID=440168 RepID=A0A1G7TIK1_9HYPH|nr:hypothetical protein SAMN04487974_102152 [Pelagibacterium luteolum]